MRVEVINTGSELLLGQVLNTHLKFLAESLLPIGLRIDRQVTVPDGPAITSALHDAAARSDVVLITGGLGPTTDDLTRDLVATWLGLDLILDPLILATIEAYFARRGLTPTSRIQRQAQRPLAATVLQNDHGTAPGLYFPPIRRPDSSLSPHLFLLPGPPRELHPMFTQRALPILISLLPSTPTNTMLTYRTTGLGESAIEALLGESLLSLGIEVGYCARLGEVDLRLIGPTATLQSATPIITSRLGSHLVSKENLSLESVVLDLLIAARQTLSTAESCTGGLLAHRLTNPPGASAAFTQSFVTYSNQAKHLTLGIPTALLESAGPVSAPVATAMAEAARHLASTDYALATTGFAGPTGGTPTDPLGTVFIALASPHLPTVVERHTFHTDRESVKILATQAALDLLRRSLLLHPPT